MNQENHSKTGLKKVIEQLIDAGTTFDTDILDKIYHNNLQIIMIEEEGHKMCANKETFKNIFRAKKEADEEPLNTWVLFHHIEVQEDKGHALLSRKVNLTGEEKNILLSIDFVWESNRWQVTREVIVPDYI